MSNATLDSFARAPQSAYLQSLLIDEMFLPLSPAQSVGLQVAYSSCLKEIHLYELSLDHKTTAKMDQIG